jgi:hypothetical protein
MQKWVAPVKPNVGEAYYALPSLDQPRMPQVFDSESVAMTSDASAGRGVVGRGPYDGLRGVDDATAIDTVTEYIKSPYLVGFLAGYLVAYWHMKR